MKSFVTTALLVLSFSFSAFADSRIEDAVSLGNCGGNVELRSYIDSQTGESKYALKFNNVSACSNVRLSTGKSYKLTDKNGNFIDKSLTLSDDAVAQARNGGLGMLVESNTGSTSSEVSVHITPVVIPSYPSQPTSPSAPAPTSW